MLSRLLYPIRSKFQPILTRYCFNVSSNQSPPFHQAFLIFPLPFYIFVFNLYHFNSIQPIVECVRPVPQLVLFPNASYYWKIDPSIDVRVAADFESWSWPVSLGDGSASKKSLKLNAKEATISFNKSIMETSVTPYV